MKRWIAFMLCLVTLVSLTACGGNGTAATDPTEPDYSGTFRAGFGRVDITPSLGIGLAGMGDDATRRAEYVKDPLYMTCIALTDENDTTVLLLTYDNIRTEPSVYSAAVSKITKKLGVPRENIIYSATHNHSSPDSANGSYSTVIKDAALEAATLAMEDRKPAEMYTGNTEAPGITFVRHYIMNDGSLVGDNYGDDTGKDYVKHETEGDTQCQLIKLARKDGKDIVMMNFRGHPLPHADIGYRDISSNYIGYCRDSMEDALDCHFAYFQGCSGNVDDSSRIKSEEAFKTVKEQGFKLASYALEVMDDLKKVETAPIEVKKTVYKGNVRQDPPELVMACAKFTDVINNGGSTADAIAATNGLVNSKWTISGVTNRANRYRTGNGKFDLDLYAIAIGDVAFLSTPNELFDNTGMQIKEASPYEQTFILYLANGRGNYVPSEPAFTNGCYEKDQGYFVKGTAEELVTVYTSMLNELKAEKPVEKPIDEFDSKLPNA